MAQKDGGATAVNSGPARVCSTPNDALGLSRVEAKSPADRDPAPLHLLVDPRRCRCVRANGGRCECVPTVLTWRRGTSVFVGIQNPVWGHGAKVKECLGGEPAAAAYAAKLWQELRALAWAEHARRERNKDLTLREAIARLGGGQ